MFKNFLAFVLVLAGISAFAEEKVKFNFPDEELTTIIKTYAQASGQKFIVDSTVRGRVMILNPSEITTEEAYNQLSEALALNGYAILKNGDVFTIKNARAAQRDNVQVSEQLPTAKPQRMATWVVSLKNISAFDIMRDLRMVTSSYGEMSSSTQTNQLVITDWTSNLQRVAELIKQVDKPADPSVAKIVMQAQKERKNQKETKNIKNKDSDSKKPETTEK